MGKNNVVLRIAMWSGPRNISTAMMRSWENREDTCVVDEPFYGYYLRQTGLKHPGYKEVIASQPARWQEVAENLSKRPIPRERGRETVFYQKHMTHHMLPEIELDWCVHLKHCFLIRDPLEVVQSYIKKNELRGEEDIGVKRQQELYEQISQISGQHIPVIDAGDFLQNPEGMLRRLCNHFGLDFTERMLSWPAGRRRSDGVWAKYWYDAVEKSTRFQSREKREIRLEPRARAIAEESRAAYSQLYDKRVTC